ncbi:FUSC family protein [Streptomyces sp. NPDC057702]|uniref:FUSC family protein n=1 Tax=unclassified Streptomyces TaxID=2593676 RepID=UPI0036833BF8
MTWLRALKETARTGLTIERTRLEPLVALRGACGVAIVIGLILWLESPPLAVASAFGAFASGVATFQRSWRPRPVLALAAAAGLAVSTFLGYVAAAHPLAFVILLGLWSLLAGMAWAVGPVSGLVATQMVAVMLVTVTLPTSVLGALHHAALIAFGGLVQAALIVLVPIRPWGAQRDALADAFAAEADFARRLREDPVAPFDPQPLMDARHASSMTPRQARRRPQQLRGYRALAERVRPVLASLADPVIGAPATGPERDRVRELLRAAGTVLDAVAHAIRRGQPVRLPVEAMRVLEVPASGPMLHGAARRSALRLMALLAEVVESADEPLETVEPVRPTPANPTPAHPMSPGPAAADAAAAPPTPSHPTPAGAGPSHPTRAGATATHPTQAGAGPTHPTPTGPPVTGGTSPSGPLTAGEEPPPSRDVTAKSPPAPPTTDGTSAPDAPATDGTSAPDAPATDGTSAPDAPAASTIQPPPAQGPATPTIQPPPAQGIPTQPPPAQGPEGEPVERAVPRNALLRPTMPRLVPVALRALRREVRWSSPVLRHAVRLAVVACAGYLVGTALPLGHGYWAPMASVMVMRPDFEQTYSRGVARFAGTLVGVVAGGAVMALGHPGEWVSAGLAVVCVGLMYLLMRTGFTVASACISAYVVFLLGIAGEGWSQTVQDRVGLTLLGGVLAMAAYALFPAWETPKLRDRLADWLLANGRYAVAVFGGHAHPLERRPRHVRDALLDARAARLAWEQSEARAQAEPVRHRGISRRSAGAAQTALSTMGRVTMLLEAHPPDRAAPASPEAERFAAALRAELPEAATAVRERQPLDWHETHAALVAWRAREGSEALPVRCAELLVDALDELAGALSRGPGGRNRARRRE